MTRSIARVAAIVAAPVILATLLCACASSSIPQGTTADARVQAQHLVDEFIATIPEDAIIERVVVSDRPFFFENASTRAGEFPARARYSYYVRLLLDPARYPDDDALKSEFVEYVDRTQVQGITWNTPALQNDYTTRFTSKQGGDTPWVYGVDGLNNSQKAQPGETYAEVTAFSPPMLWDQATWDESIRVPQVWPKGDIPDGAVRIEDYGKNR
ncbi:hypothetical protein [Microbacterium dextranolyticum]|uniref:Uncharacterized protein n=1 Tax=Microbacterium dextranolyticum TaxID=36806 RepID=A0A9W6HIS2_9MICO|nr:hypothetical protein [Microbacterium dextranolyticum]MBM7461711.1 hypothetical protein [Microbacterium dextranolyticum]GLJ93951.1 hypothetical protein GCM10017591_00120 [Microbacterium dextranolyticum]